MARSKKSSRTKAPKRRKSVPRRNSRSRGAGRFRGDTKSARVVREFPQDLVNEMVQRAKVCLTVPVGVTEQRTEGAPNPEPIDNTTEAKECDLFFIPDMSWFGNLDYDTVRNRLTSAFAVAKIPDKWMYVHVHPRSGVHAKVEWSNDPQRSSDNAQQWKAAGNDEASFPKNAVDLLPNVAEVVRSLAGADVPHSLTYNAPETLEYKTYYSGQVARFEGRGSVEYCRFATSARMLNKETSKLWPDDVR